MLETQIDQSGAGKTETTKHVLKYLAFVAGDQKEGVMDVSQQILQSNPVLEVNASGQGYYAKKSKHRHPQIFPLTTLT